MHKQGTVILIFFLFGLLHQTNAQVANTETVYIPIHNTSSTRAIQELLS